jgi:IMP dehydrogenase
MMIKDSLCFDDVLLIPKKSDINSRGEIDLSTNLGSHKFRLPIISSPMDTVTETQMAISMFAAGGLGIIHRYNTIVKQTSLVREVFDYLEETNNSNMNKVSAAIGTSSDFLERALSLYKAGARILCIDVAHGHHTLVEKSIKSLKDALAQDITIIAGNVATAEGFKDLSDWGADAVRIGIGGGSICSTRIQTGHGVPTLQSVLDCRDAADASIIADGGVKTAGDIVKALAAGAHSVMIGSLFAGTAETPGQVILYQGRRYKLYRGMGSLGAMKEGSKDRYFQTGVQEVQKLVPEGIEGRVPYKGPLAESIFQFTGGLRAGMGYTGCASINELQNKASYVRISNAGLRESHVHDVYITEEAPNYPSFKPDA